VPHETLPHMKERRFLSLLFLLAVGSSASAQIVTVPPDLAPGAGYRLIFVTSTVRTGASGSPADYNAFVSAAANAVPALAALGTTWTAVAETPGLEARDNTGTNPAVSTGVPFYRLDGLRVANDNVYFWGMAFPINPISITQVGTAAPVTARSPDGSIAAWVWTGDGTSSQLGTGFPVAGWAHSGGANSWIGVAIANNANSFPMYGVSGILTVPPVVSVPMLPAIGWIALIVVLAALGAWMLRGRAR
jgi:hypothetical protein